MFLHDNTSAGLVIDGTRTDFFNRSIFATGRHRSNFASCMPMVFIHLQAGAIGVATDRNEFTDPLDGGECRS
ncbi:MAG: hypothetical protein H7315_14580 [Herminiimonas sp.]|nr:hypothetical protein [Herminiimonas sp.]